MASPVKNKIRYYAGSWCVFSRDESWVLSRHPSHADARDWLANRYTGEEKPVALSRHVHLMAATGELRAAMFEDREHLVVPVVALVEGVLFAANATGPELVLAQEFARSPQGWNGRPVMYDHPSYAGGRTSANDPKTLEKGCFGTVFNTKVDGTKLCMEAWLDLSKAEAVGAQPLIDAMRNGKMIEVSVGVFVAEEQQAGEWNGQAYTAIWRDIVPDHLAALPLDKTGACSNVDGCGAPRAATIYLATAEGWTITPGKNDRIDVVQLTEEDHVKKGWKEKIGHLLEGLRGAADSVSDSELRGKLHDALRAIEPGYLWLEDVYPDEGLVIYCVAPTEETVTFRRGYTLDADGLVSLSPDKEQVERTMDYVPVMMAAGAGGCSCQTPKTAKEDETMKTIKDRVAAIIASGKTPFKAASAPLLEKLTEEELKALEDQVAAVPVVVAPVVETPVLTVDEERSAFLAKFPDIKAVLDREQARAASARASVITKLKAAGQKAFTDEELAAMPLAQLEKIASIAVKPETKVDFTGSGGRTAESSDDRPTKVADPTERFRAAQKSA